MIMAAIALTGALLSPQELDQTTGLGAAWSPAALMDLAFSSGGSGSVAMSVQELSMTTTGVTLQAQPGFDLVNLRTGDVMIDGAGAMSGIQAQTINSGIGSSVTAAVSIAAHAV